MPRSVRRVVPLSLFLVVVLSWQSSALAANFDVTIVDFAFTPKATQLQMGDSVTWTNTGNALHTSTGDRPLRLWDSPIMSAGQSYTLTFTAAGIYSYHCRFHPYMHGRVSARDLAAPLSGHAGTVFTITVATVPAPTGFVYDVQMKAPGGVFQDWMLGIVTTTAQFDSTGQPTGQYQFRSRMHRVSPVDGPGEYSLPAAISVTP
jgi:plastocyanin